MSWSYSGDPSSSDRDMVRFRLGDTDTTDQLVTNEEIDALLAIPYTVTETAIACARSLAARFSRRPASKKVGDLSITYGELAKQFWNLAAQLASDPATAGSSPVWVGGVSVAERDALRANTDYIRPYFERDMDEETTLDERSE